MSRLAAAIIDVALLGAVNAAVLYFTLAIAGLTLDEVGLLPIMPLAAFLLLLNGGYLVAFTAAGGQTIGKMTAGIRVMNDDYQRVDLTGALLRAIGCVVCAAMPNRGCSASCCTSSSASTTSNSFRSSVKPRTSTWSRLPTMTG